MSVLHAQDKPLVLTQLSYIELMFGLDREKKKHRDEERVIDSLFKDFSVLKQQRLPHNSIMLLRKKEL